MLLSMTETYPVGTPGKENPPPPTLPPVPPPKK